MKNAIKSILHIKFLVILIIAQFSTGIFILNTSSFIGQEAERKSSNLDRLFDINTTYLIKIGFPDNVDWDSNPFDEVIPTYKELDILKDDFTKLKESLLRNVFSSKLLGLSLTIVSLIGVTAIMYGRISERKKEIGIKLACGSTKKL